MDTYDRWSVVEDKIFYIDEAIRSLGEAQECGDIVNLLQDRRAELSDELAALEAELQAEAAREQEAMEREYWLSVI